MTPLATPSVPSPHTFYQAPMTVIDHRPTVLTDMPFEFYQAPKTKLLTVILDP